MLTCYHANVVQSIHVANTHVPDEDTRVLPMMLVPVYAGTVYCLYWDSAGWGGGSWELGLVHYDLSY